MQTLRLQKFFQNPGLGLLPYAFFILLYILNVPVSFAASLSLIFAVTGAIFSTIYFRCRSLRLSFEISSIALVLVLLIKLIGSKYIINNYSYIIVGEIILAFCLMFLNFAHVFFKSYLRKGRSKTEKALVNDYIFTISLLQSFMIIHLLITFAYKQITTPRIYASIEYFLYLLVPLIIIVGMYLYQYLRIRYIEQLLKKEEWLPIVNDMGQVTGKIARRVSANMRNKHRHPIIRIILVMNNKVYLQNRSMSEIHEPGKIDHPLEKYITYSNDFNQTINKLALRVKGGTKEQPQFLMEYSFESENTKRLIYVYSLKIEHEEALAQNKGFTGKFWSMKQIEEEFNDGIFSECFELEYEYVKNVLLLNDANTILKKEYES